MKKFVTWILGILASLAAYYFTCVYFGGMTPIQTGELALVLACLFIGGTVVCVCGIAALAVAAVVLFCVFWLAMVGIVNVSYGCNCAVSYLAKKLEVRTTVMFLIILVIIGALLFILLW